MSRFLVALSLALFAAPATQAQTWYDSFDTYFSKAPLTRQSDWEEGIWGGGDSDVLVVSRLAFNGNNSVLLKGPIRPDGDNVVYDFTHLPGGQPTSGTWVLSYRTFVPSGATGKGCCILQSRYPDTRYSHILCWDPERSRVRTFNNFAGLPLLFDVWAAVTVCINLDEDRLDVWYGQQRLVENASWINGYGPTGPQQIAAVRLSVTFGNGAPGIEEMYFDAFRFERVGKGKNMALVANPNPVARGQQLDLLMSAPELPGAPAALFLWTVNGAPFIQPLLTTSLDANGDQTISATVPRGLTGLDLGFKAFGVPSSGYTSKSNEEWVLFR